MRVRSDISGLTVFAGATAEARVPPRRTNCWRAMDASGARLKWRLPVKIGESHLFQILLVPPNHSLPRLAPDALILPRTIFQSRTGFVPIDRRSLRRYNP